MSGWACCMPSPLQSVITVPKSCGNVCVQVGAWKTGSDIRPDEVVHSELKLTYDGKRDRYNGYDPAAYKGVMDRCVGYPCTGP